jgi:hypothetical protein
MTAQVDCVVLLAFCLFNSAAAVDKFPAIRLLPVIRELWGVANSAQ